MTTAIEITRTLDFVPFKPSFSQKLGDEKLLKLNMVQASQSLGLAFKKI